MTAREYLEKRMDRAEKEGAANLAEELWRKIRELCGSCGEREGYPQHDAYGIYAGKLCDQCFHEKYRQDRYFDAGYAGESLEPEEGSAL